MSSPVSNVLGRVTVVLWLACVVFLAWAYYNEYVLGMMPCPLCSIQRFILIVMVLLMLVAWVARRGLSVWVDTLQCLLSVLGIVAAGRHWWLQTHPITGETCFPGFSTLLDTMPWHRALWLAFKGSPTCSEVTWRILGVSSAVWLAALFFVLLMYFIVRLVSPMED